MTARVAALCALVLAGCGGGEKPSAALPGGSGRPLALTSPAFGDDELLPARFTCSGDGISPPLAWSGVPKEARELTLIVEDPDAGRFVHWTVLHIPATTTGVDQDSVPKGGVETENSFGKRGWGAPCPPKGDQPHRYVFALYATSDPLRLGADATQDEIRARLAVRAIALGTLTGHFSRDG